MPTLNALVNADRDIIQNEILPAILAGQTYITRRCEIYEADGVTRYLPDTFINVTDGNVALDYSADARRTLDLTIDNSDGSIVHNPDGGLWYDKVIKIFRGIQYTPQKKSPKLAVVGGNAYDTNGVLRNLLRIGYADITFFPADGTTLAADLVPYDIIVGWSQDADLSAGQKTLLLECYRAGMAILTLCNKISATTIPWITAIASQPTSGTALLSLTAGADNPYVATFKSYAFTYAAGEIYPTVSSLAPGVVAIAGGASGRAMQYEAPNGARWFHYQPKLIPTTQNDGNLAKQNRFLKSAMDWLFNYSSTGVWETQIGEFVLDTINEPSFPNNLQLTGRDYSKRMDLAKFDVPTEFKAGVSLVTTLRGLANKANIAKYKFGITDQNLAKVVSFDADDTILTAFQNLASAYTFEWFFDRNGVLIVRDFLDPINAPISLRLQTGSPNGNLVEYTKSSDDTNTYNRWVVIGENNSGDDTYYAVATNDDPASPSSTVRLGSVRTAPVSKSALYTSTAACQKAANAKKSVGSLENYSLDFSALVAPWIEVGEILEFIDPDDATAIFPTRMLFTAGSIPLSLSPMSGTGKRVAIVDASGVVNP